MEWSFRPRTEACCESGKIGARMPSSARTLLGFFGELADVGIRAPEQDGLWQTASDGLGSSGVCWPEREIALRQIARRLDDEVNRTDPMHAEGQAQRPCIVRSIQSEEAESRVVEPQELLPGLLEAGG